MTVPRISVVVPTRRRVALITRLLHGLANQDLDHGEFEVIVVHEGDAAMSALLDEWQAKLPLRAIVLAPCAVVPKRNAGWRAAQAPLVAFTDDDCEPTPSWLRNAIAAFDDAAPTLDLVQGRIDRHPDDGDVEGIFKRTIEVHEHYEGYPNANLVFRRRALERVGGYDEAFWGAGEDADLAFRVRESGGDVAYRDDVVMWHAVRPVSFVEHLQSLPRWGNGALTIKRHPQLRPLLIRRVFWKESHTTGSLALLGLLLVVVDWRFALLAVPHVRRRVREAGLRNGVQLAVADVVEVAITVSGSVRYRTLFI